jgi:hypothetical protein
MVLEYWSQPAARLGAISERSLKRN